MKDQLTPEEQAEMAEIMKDKTGVMVAVPNLDGNVSIALAHWWHYLGFRTVDPECKYFFKIHAPNGLYPHEWARNQCVREFLKDPLMKKLWFIDADMVPPAEALDLLDFDEPMVSGQTFIWMAETTDSDGFYKHPIMKVNAFKYRRSQDDFISIVPPNDGKAFYCDSAGAACLVIKREVLEDMPEPWFRTVRDPYGRMLRSEDLDFTKRATDRRHRLLYVPKVQFGHLKEVDLKQVTRYGTASMRDIIEQVKATDDPEKIKGALPDIVFSGERPREKKEEPVKLEVISGGAA